MPIEKDDLTKELDKIASNLDFEIGKNADTIRMVALFLHKVIARLKAYEELGLTTNANLKDLDIRVSELERWRDARESYEREQNE